jgi:ribosomal protein S18 acetylase RimI-like enzyme
MLIRPFEHSDAGALNALALAAFDQYRGVYSDWETLSRGVGSMASLAEGGEILVAEDEAGRIMGGVAYFGPGAGPRADFFEPHWPIIRMLVVDPAARGKGIGRSLTEECIARARRDGADAIALHTSPAMEVALAMYLNMGFSLVRKVPERFGVPYGLYLMPLSRRAD